MNINGNAKVASFSNRSKHTRDLDERFPELLDKDSPTGRTLWVSVRNNLRQFNLTGSHSEACVINEDYIRTVKVYEKGEKIDNSATGLAFWSLVRENIQRFNLTGSHSEACVINEDYIRTVKVYEKGEKIDNLFAWCRKTAYNYDGVYNFASIIPPKLI